MQVETAFILLFVVATAVAIATRWVRLPYTVALVLAGLALGGVKEFPAPHLTKDLLFAVFLPGLLFEAAFHLDLRELRESWMTILTLAVPGVIASIALVVAALTPVIAWFVLAPGFSWRDALAFGALISATDPVAVVALFRNMGAPRRLTMLLDGESLLNDGTAIVFFTLSLSLLSGSVVTASALTLQFVAVVGGGVLVGGAIGAAVLLLVRNVDDPMIEITLTTVAAYGSFAAADSLNVSGVIATVTAGMLCGNLGAASVMSASTRVAAETFWQYVTFALNSIVFLLIGLQVHVPTLWRYWPAILVAYLVVTLGRALLITGGYFLMSRTRERFPWRWSIVLTWGGLRGALPMVLALSLPQSFVYRHLIISMTFGVAVLSILVHGLTMPALLRWLGVMDEVAERSAYELRRGRLEAAAAALAELDEMAQLRMASPEVLEPLRAEYRATIESAEQELAKLIVTRQQLQDREMHAIRRRLLGVERDRVMQAFSRGSLGRQSEQKLLADIDARLVALEMGEEHKAPPESGSAAQPQPGGANPGGEPGAQGERQPPEPHSP